MTRSTGAQIGLLSFAVTTAAGIYAGNSVTVILLRALVALFLGAVGGQVLAWAAKAVLREHLQRKKAAIDRAHADAMRAFDAARAGADQTPDVSG